MWSLGHIEVWKDIGGRCFEMVTWNNTESHLAKCDFFDSGGFYDQIRDVKCQILQGIEGKHTRT